MERFEKMSIEARVVFLLTLTDLIKEKLSGANGYELAINAIDSCWKWLKAKNIEADDLYYFLENIDENDVFTFMELDEDENNEGIWICIANALAYTIWAAYMYEKARYMPQTIESVDIETIESFIENYPSSTINDFSDKFCDYLIDRYPVDGETAIDEVAVRDYLGQLM